MHFAEASELDGLVEFTSSGMTHVNEVYATAPNRHRVAGPYVDHQFGLVEIEWERKPIITLKAVGVDGAVAFSYRVGEREEGK